MTQITANDLRPAVANLQRTARIVGVIAAVLVVIGYFTTGAQALQSYLFGYFLFLVVALGGLFVLMLESVTDGVWGLIIRRHLEAVALTIPVMAALFIPIALTVVLGNPDLFPWLSAEYIKKHPVVEAKLAYLNPPFWLIRALIAFAVWSYLAIAMRRLSDIRDRTGDLLVRNRMRRLAGPGILAFMLTWMVAATDWGMSIEPEWFSSMFPVTFVLAMLVATMASSIVVMTMLTRRNLLPFKIPTDRLHDLGKLLFAFVIVWSYINFSQFLIIWAGNIPEETPWYYYRLNHGWEVIGIALMLGHFFIPIFLLISREAKRNTGFLTGVAIFLLVVETLFVFWQIMPSYHRDAISVSWLDFVAPVAVGGIWLSFYLGNLASRPLLPTTDARLALLEAQQRGGHGHGSHTAADHGRADAHGEAHV